MDSDGNFIKILKESECFPINGNILDGNRKGPTLLNTERIFPATTLAHILKFRVDVANCNFSI